MGYWTRFLKWCRRPDMIKRPGMIKIQRFNPSIGWKGMRTKPFQIGFAVIMGWITLMVPYFVIQASTRPGGEELFWVCAFLGLGLMGSGIVLKAKEWFNTIGTTLLQTGVAITMILTMTLIQREGSLDLGLPYPFFGWAHTYFGTFPAIFFGIPLFGLVLFVPFSGLVLVEGRTKKRIKSWWSKSKDKGRWKRFVEWCQRPAMIKIRRFNLNPSIAVIGVICVIDVLFVANAPILLGPLANTSGINAPTNMAAASLLPSKVLGGPLDSGSIDTETLYVDCGSTLTAEAPTEDIRARKSQIEHTRAQYKEIVIHVFKVPSWSDYDARDIIHILSHAHAYEGMRTDVDWYEDALSSIEWENRVTVTKGDRSAFFWRSGTWVFGVDAENYRIRNDAARVLIQHLKNLEES